MQNYLVFQSNSSGKEIYFASGKNILPDPASFCDFVCRNTVCTRRGGPFFYTTLKGAVNFSSQIFSGVETLRHSSWTWAVCWKYCQE